MTYTDLTDAEIEAVARQCDYAGYEIRNRAREGAPICVAIIALARANKRIAALEEENFMLAAGACINPGGNGLLGDEHGNSFCGVEVERAKLDEQLTNQMAKNNALQAEFDAYRKDVAEGVKWPNSWGTKTISYEWWHARFARFAAPEPEPDLLEECIQEVWQYAKGCEHMVPMRTKELRQAAASKGYVIEVRKAGHDA